MRTNEIYFDSITIPPHESAELTLQSPVDLVSPIELPYGVLFCLVAGQSIRLYNAEDEEAVLGETRWKTTVIEQEASE